MVVPAINVSAYRRSSACHLPFCFNNYGHRNQTTRLMKIMSIQYKNTYALSAAGRILLPKVYEIGKKDLMVSILVIQRILCLPSMEELYSE